MGSGGHTTGKKSEFDVYKRAPHSKPPFTLSQLKKAIPPHCFKRSFLRSFSYILSDLAVVCLLSYVSTTFFHRLPHPLSYIAWPISWYIQGCFLVGLWVIAHECGHQAFSEYHLLNDTVGLIIHSSLLVPYFSWKISHRLHHSNASLLERDESFVPKFKTEIPWYFRNFNNPPGRVLMLLGSALSGWPLYLLCNVTGRTYERWACHFDPYSPMYTDRERILIVISDVGVLGGIYALYRLAVAKGLAWFMCVYGAPMVVVHAFLVIIIFLHHTHPSLPHYDSSEWDWLRGALSTVDRNYGVLNKVFHHIADTHVLHHLFSMIPHYHAEEATNAIKPILGEYYRTDFTPIYKAVWREVRECIYVEPDADGGATKGVFWFNNKV